MTVDLNEAAFLLKTEIKYVKKLIRDKIIVARKDGQWKIEESSLNALRYKYPWRLSLRCYRELEPLRDVVEELANIQWTYEWADTHMSALLGITEKHWMRMRNHRVAISRPVLKQAMENFPGLERIFSDRAN